MQSGSDVPASDIKVVGSYLSPYVRKVLVCLGLKGMPYEIDPLVPFFGSERFTRLNPLRRIPLLFDGDHLYRDSTAICEYLNENYPSPGLMPQTAEERAHARWLEEFADTRMGDVFIWHYYNQLYIRKHIWKEEPEHEVLTKATQEEIPELLDYLESELPEAGYLFGALSVADISIASFFKNAMFCGFSVYEERWPRVARFLDAILQIPEFARLEKYELISLRTPVGERNAALASAGAPLWDSGLAEKVARKGVMSV